MSTSLSSSLDVLSLTSSSRWASDSLSSDEDEIVWSLSSSALLSTSPPLQSPLSETADFVLVPRATAAAAPPTATADMIADEMASLSLTPALPPPPVQGGSTTTVRRSARLQQQAVTREQQTSTTASPAVPRKKKRAKRTHGSSHGSSSSASSIDAAASSPNALPSRIGSAGKRKAKKARAKRKAGATSSATAATGLGAVDDSVSETSESSTPSIITADYQEAHKYMTSCVYLSPTNQRLIILFLSRGIKNDASSLSHLISFHFHRLAYQSTWLIKQFVPGTSHIPHPRATMVRRC